jgi:Domain of unknown function (DUF4157)
MQRQTQLKSSAVPAIAFTPVHGGLLQRKCACDGAPEVVGECEGCNKKRLQRKAQNSEMEARNESAVPQIVHEVLRSPGQPLDATTRAYMESRFGHDFSRIRVHTDPSIIGSDIAVNQPDDLHEQEASRVSAMVMHAKDSSARGANFSHIRVHVGEVAAESARAVNARAYTVGQNIIFGEGYYSPSTFGGKQLIAHELTHAVQQRSVPGRSFLQRSPKESENRDPLPYRQAMEATEQGLYDEYTRNCSGVRTLSRLERLPPISPFERTRRLEDRLKFIPIYFRQVNSSSSEGRSANDVVNEAAYRCVRECIFGKGYAPLSEEGELATARCELSEARWQSVALAHHGHIPGSGRGRESDKVPWVPDPRDCSSPDRMEQLRKHILSGRGCGGEVKKGDELIL